MLKCIAVIPARIGSKRIPLKNIKNFNSKPMISYPIEVARKSDLFDDIIVSTDSEVIADVSKSFGAKVPFLRSKENSTDNSTLMDVLIEVKNNLEIENVKFKYVCCILPTAPLLKKERLREGFNKIYKNEFDSVASICKFSTPIQRSLSYSDNKLKTIKMIYPEYTTTRTQDLPSCFFDAGQFYWLRDSAIEKGKQIFNENTGAVELPEIEVQDIDNLVDWQIAELKYQFLQKKLK